MSVLFVSYSGGLGGAERLLVDFAAAVPGERFLACPDGELARAARAGGMRVIALRTRPLRARMAARDRLSSLAHLAGHAREVRRLARSLDPELLVAWGMRSALACAADRGRSSTRASLVFQHNDLLPGGLTGALVRVAAGRCDLVLALSHTIARDLDPRGRMGVVVVHPGIDVERFSGEPPPPGPPEVLVLGALVGWKRPDLALDALALVREQVPEARLRLVGASLEGHGPLLERLHERASHAELTGAVELAGAEPDPAAALHRASCLLHCAEREPFGLAVLEALAAGRPAVVPAGAGPAEIVDQACGLLYAPGDAAGAANRLITLLRSPDRALQMGVSGRARAREHFGRAAAHRRYATVLEGARQARRRGEGGPGPPASPPRDLLSIVTVTHNSAPQLAGLLRSVERHLPGIQVIVADTASRDDSVAVARDWGGNALVLDLGRNAGFGSACNRALREVRAPVTALLNPDVELLDDSLLSLAREALRPETPDRLLAPLVLLADGTRQDSVHPPPASAPDLLRALVPPSALPRHVATALAPWRADRPRRVGWAVGCALLAQTPTLAALGPFDERLFLYGEDLDLGLRAADAGVQTWFWPGARILHHRAHTTHAVFGGEPFELLARARREVVARRLGARRVRLDDAGQALTFASRSVLKRALGRSAARERRQLRALAAVRAAR